MQKRKVGQPHKGWKGAARIKYSRQEDCPSFYDHTPHPSGYIQHHAWMKKMSRTHKQFRCTACGYWAIWEPKKTDAPPVAVIGEDRP